MPRTSRVAPGGMVFHVLNRGVGRQRLFDKPADYAAFESIVEETLSKQPMRICSYCLMPNHWHFVLWPQNDGDLAAFLQRMTVTHATRWQKHRRRVGEGHIYQGRFKSFPVETDEHFYQVVRYVERNALRAGLADLAEDLALVEPLAARTRHARPASLAGRLAAAPSAPLVGPGQRTADRRGAGSAPPGRRPRSPVRFGSLDRTDGASARPGIHDPIPRPPPQGSRGGRIMDLSPYSALPRQQAHLRRPGMLWVTSLPLRMILGGGGKRTSLE